LPNFEEKKGPNIVGSTLYEVLKSKESGQSFLGPKIYSSEESKDDNLNHYKMD